MSLILLRQINSDLKSVHGVLVLGLIQERVLAYCSMTMIHQALLSHSASCGEDQIHRHIYMLFDDNSKYLIILFPHGAFQRTDSETNDFKWNITRLKILTGRRRSSWLLADKCSYQSMRACGLQVQGSKRSAT